MADALPKSVVIFYPTGGTNEDCFTHTLIGAVSYDAAHRGYIADVMGIVGAYIDTNRDLGCRNFMRYRLCSRCRAVINRGDILRDRVLHCNWCDIDVPEPLTPDWIWWLDTDISLPSWDVLDRLLASADPIERPVMSALYFGYMNGPENGVVPVWYGRDEMDGRIENLIRFRSGLNRLGVVGMGCCIIHRSVFEKFGTKYQNTGFLYFGRDRAPWVILADVNNDMTPFGEDNCFCHRCEEQGIPVYGNADIVVNHMKKRFENFDTFLQSFARTETDFAKDEKRVVTRLRRESPKTIRRSRPGNVGELDYAGYQSGSSPGCNPRFKQIATTIRGEPF